MSQLAMCRNCDDEPLVATFVFPKKEFVCLGCGRLYEWLQPAGADETPELLAKSEARDAEWKQISDGYLAIGMKRLDDCDACRTSGDYSHRDHATEDELRAHEQAEDRIAAFRESKPAALR